MDKLSSPRPFRVAIVPVDGFALMSYAATVEPLRAVNDLSNHTLYEIVNVPVDGVQATASNGAIIPAQATLDRNADYDLVLIVAGGNAVSYSNPKLANWVRRLARAGVQIGGVSAGPLFLARIGLLHGHRMTVHWEHSDALSEVAPEMLFERSLYVIDRKRMTCGGGTAPIDLMLALIADQHGQRLAQLVGDWFLHTSIRPPGGPQRASLAARHNTTNTAVLNAIEAMENHVADPLSLSQLSQIIGVSPRQLTRLFAHHTGKTPIAFCRALRLSKARNLLANTSVSLSDVALMTGFSSAGHFSSAFTQKYEATPSSLRLKTP